MIKPSDKISNDRERHFDDEEEEDETAANDCEPTADQVDGWERTPSSDSRFS